METLFSQFGAGEFEVGATGRSKAIGKKVTSPVAFLLASKNGKSTIDARNAQVFHEKDRLRIENIERAVWEMQRTLRHVERSVYCLLHPHVVIIESLTIKENSMPLLAIAPGNSPVFTVTGNTAETNPSALTPAPAADTRATVAKPRVSAAAIAADTTVVTTLSPAPVWTSSDEVNAPVTAAGDGLTATVNIPTDAVVGTAFTLTATYTNADGSMATGTLSLTIVADVIPVVDITSLTITQTT